MLLTSCRHPRHSLVRSSDFNHMRGQMDRFFGDFANSWLSSDQSEDAAQFLPATQVSESADDYKLLVELPGVTKEDVKLSLKENELTLSAEKKVEERTEGTNIWRQERAFGSFSRSFTFKQRIDASQVSASFKDGILTITVPKAEEARRRTIDVAVQ